jgi:6-phosphogluconolactonase
MNEDSSALTAVCSYSDSPSDGIFSYRLDRVDGNLHQLDSVTARNVSFLTLHPTAPYLFAAERFAGGVVSAFRFDEESGTLIRCDHRASRGSGPGYLSVDADGRYLFSANCGENTVAVFPIGADGSIGEATDVVEHTPADAGLPPYRSPHPHAVRPGPEDRFVYVPDMGLDRIFVYEFDPDRGTLSPARTPTVEVPSGTGPRHLDVHPDGRYLYVINEQNSTVTAFERDVETGHLAALQTVDTLPDGFEGENKCADIHVHPSGAWLYASNRGHDSIVSFEIDSDTGRLEAPDHTSTGGAWPRNFGVEPEGQYLYAENMYTDDVVIFEINRDSGRLTATGDRISIDSPVCMVFDGSARISQ